MTWLDYHSKSEQLAALAEIAARDGDVNRSIELYKQAAEAEAKAIGSLDVRKGRTLGITVLSAAALFYKAHNYTEAQKLAHTWLGTSLLPPFAVEQLQILLQTIWSDVVRAKASVNFSRGEVLVSIRGGEVLQGGAPLDLIILRVEGIQSLFYRTTELLRRLPHRKRGPAPLEIQQICRPWLFQTAPGSYQFAVAIQEPTQLELFPADRLKSEEISSAFLKILRTCADDPNQALSDVVPDPEYRATFLKLVRNLAPTGKAFKEISIKAASDIRAVTISTGARKMINESIRRQFKRPPPASDLTEETLTGILRAVHLDQDWLEIVIGREHIRISEVGETVDDVVGPMVNRQVAAQTLRKPNGQRILVDIQAAE